MISKVQQQQVEWRRDRVLELSSQGFSQSDIATALQVDKSIISRDVAYLRHQAQENLQKHIHETVPEEYERCMIGMKRNLKQTLEIAETVSDPRTKLQARAIVNDCYKYIMDLTTNGVVITDAIKYVNAKMDHLNTAEKKLLQDVKEDTEAEAEAEEELQKTTNGIF